MSVVVHCEGAGIHVPQERLEDLTVKLWCPVSD